MKKKILSLLLAVVTAASFVPACAYADSAKGGSFSMLNYNVAGLPDFKSLLGQSDEKIDVGEKERRIGAVIEATGVDFIAVQEDFNYHSDLKKGLASYEYGTLHYGGVPFGDGLNIFSKTPVYNVEREAWRTRFGTFIEGDELTPKGILYAVIEIADGVYADFYDIHADAFDTDGSREARIDNYNQVAEMIERHNSGRPIIITGDFNITLHHTNWDPSSKHQKELFIDKLGFKDAWVEVCNGGDYEDFSKWSKTGVSYWGNWDSVEKFLYRDGNGIHLEATDFSYEPFPDENGNPYSDHNGAMVTFDYTLDDTFKAESADALKTEKRNILKDFARKVKTFFEILGTCLANLDELKSVIGKKEA